MKKTDLEFVDNYISIFEASNYYHLPEATLLRWVSAGHLQATRRKIVRGFGRLVWAITKEEFERLPDLAEEMVSRSRNFQKVNIARRRESQQKRKFLRREHE